MKKFIYKTKYQAGKASATEAAKATKDAIKQNGQANIILATGTSQLDMLENLITDKGIDW